LKCPYCSRESYFFFDIAPRRYFRCTLCDLIFRGILAIYDEAINFYRHDYSKGLAVDQLSGSRDKLFEHILDLIESRKDIGSLLDVGTGCGYFLVAARKRGWNVEGIEPSTHSVRVARDQNGINVIASSLKESPAQSQYDVIAFINVLEHSALPWFEIRRARELLRPQGLIYLRFPNGLAHSNFYRLAQRFGVEQVVRKFVIFHPYVLTSRGVSRLLHDQGFTRVTLSNSPPSEGDPNKLFTRPLVAPYVKRLTYSFAAGCESITRGRLLAGTSLEVTAIRGTD
jgi:SAM-dependent methyltransferase